MSGKSPRAGMNHVGLTVGDIDEAVDWYAKVFGLELLDGPMHCDTTTTGAGRRREVFGDQWGGMKLAHMLTSNSWAGSGPKWHSRRQWRGVRQPAREIAPAAYLRSSHRTRSNHAIMNVLILGNGSEERAWAEWLLASGKHRLVAVFPGFAESSLADTSPSRVTSTTPWPAWASTRPSWGARSTERGENLRRAAAEGLAIICLHPPGADSEAYYQVALSRAETGAVIVPDLPLRLHPGVDSLRQAMNTGELGAFRGLRLEVPCVRRGNRPGPRRVSASRRRRSRTHRRNRGPHGHGRSARSAS